MAAEIGGKQLSTLLESLPGIASVLRSPVADAIVNMIRAGAGLDDFVEADAKELVQYATRRGLLGAEEGAELLQAVKGLGVKRKTPKIPKIEDAKGSTPAEAARPEPSTPDPVKAEKSVEKIVQPTVEKKKPAAKKSVSPKKTTKTVAKKAVKKVVAKKATKAKVSKKVTKRKK